MLSFRRPLAVCAFWTLLWGIPGAFLAVPMTLMLMMIFAQFDNTKWVAAALSNDGKPDFRAAVASMRRCRLSATVSGRRGA